MGISTTPIRRKRAREDGVMVGITKLILALYRANFIGGCRIRRWTRVVETREAGLIGEKSLVFVRRAARKDPGAQARRRHADAEWLKDRLVQALPLGGRG
jgi:hypothetical protein